MTQSRKDALQELLAKVEAGTAIPYDLIKLFSDKDYRYAYAAYDGSLDAAHDLHEAVLPGWDWCVTNDAARAGEMFGPMATIAKPDQSPHIFQSSSGTPSRAWLIAIIKALIAEADASPDP